MPQQPHIIRLRSPWEWTIRRTPPATPSRACWILRRRFNCPTGLHTDDRVVLVVDGLESAQRLTLNGRLLELRRDEQAVLRCDIREHLRLRNDLTIELHITLHAAEDDLRGRIERDVLSAGRVRLEIYSR